MFTDPSGCMPKWLAWTLSGSAIIGGIILCATGVGGILGTVLIGAGAGSIINGYISEANGGDFTAGYIGGAISGALCATGAGLGGLAFNAASNAVGAACIGYVALGLGTSFAGGFVGNIAGELATNWIDPNLSISNMDWNSTINTSLVMGGLNIFAGLASGMSSMAGKMGKEMVVRSLSDANSVMALRLLAGTIAGSTETVFDLLTYLVKKLTSKF